MKLNISLFLAHATAAVLADPPDAYSPNIDCTKLDCFDKQAFSYLAEDENAIHILANGEVGLRVKYAIYDYKTGLPSEAGTEVRESPDFFYGTFTSWIPSDNKCYVGQSRFEKLSATGYDHASLTRVVNLRIGSFIKCGQGVLTQMAECPINGGRGIYYFHLDAAPDDKCIAKAKTKYNITLDKAAIEKAMKGTAPFIMNGTRAEIPLPAGYVWPPTKRGPDGL